MPKPRRDGGNIVIVYDALTSVGLVTPTHSSHIGSSIASDNQYDQIAIFPETAKAWLLDLGVSTTMPLSSKTSGPARAGQSSTATYATTFPTTGRCGSSSVRCERTW